MPDTQHDVIVVGCGVAGLAAARRLARAGLSVAATEQLLFGGLITNVNQLDGEVAGSGSEVAAAMMEEVMDLGVDQLQAQVGTIARDGDGLIVTSDSGMHGARAVIVASGARLKRLGVPGEAEFEHRGVSHCADCDGPMLAGREVAVVGGGDSALQSALVLAQHCKRVHLIHRGAAFRAWPHLASAVEREPKIEIHRGARVQALQGDSQLESVRLDEGGRTFDLPVHAFFAYVGLEAASECCDAGLERDAAGRLLTDAARRTAMPGLYAAGAVRAGCGGRIVDAIADGEAAADAVAESLRVVA